MSDEGDAESMSLAAIGKQRPVAQPNTVTLRVQLKEASGLMAVPRRKSQLADPSVQIKLAGQSQESRVLKLTPANSHAVWDQDLVFKGALREFEETSLALELFDNDGKTKQFMGAARVKLRGLRTQYSKEFVEELSGPQSSLGQPQGSLRFRLTIDDGTKRRAVAADNGDDDEIPIDLELEVLNMFVQRKLQKEFGSAPADQDDQYAHVEHVEDDMLLILAARRQQHAKAGRLDEMSPETSILAKQKCTARKSEGLHRSAGARKSNRKSVKKGRSSRDTDDVDPMDQLDLMGFSDDMLRTALAATKTGKYLSGPPPQKNGMQEHMVKHHEARHEEMRAAFGALTQSVEETRQQAVTFIGLKPSNGGVRTSEGGRTSSRRAGEARKSGARRLLRKSSLVSKKADEDEDDIAPEFLQAQEPSLKLPMPLLIAESQPRRPSLTSSRTGLTTNTTKKAPGDAGQDLLTENATDDDTEDASEDDTEEVTEDEMVDHAVSTHDELAITISDSERAMSSQKITVQDMAQSKTRRGSDFLDMLKYERESTREHVERPPRRARQRKEARDSSTRLVETDIPAGFDDFIPAGTAVDGSDASVEVCKHSSRRSLDNFDDFQAALPSQDEQPTADDQRLSRSTKLVDDETQSKTRRGTDFLDMLKYERESTKEQVDRPSRRKLKKKPPPPQTNSSVPIRAPPSLWGRAQQMVLKDQKPPASRFTALVASAEQNSRKDLHLGHNAHPPQMQTTVQTPSRLSDVDGKRVTFASEAERTTDVQTREDERKSRREERKASMRGGDLLDDLTGGKERPQRRSKGRTSSGASSSSSEKHKQAHRRPSSKPPGFEDFPSDGQPELRI